jgi:hypothetical protein
VYSLIPEDYSPCSILVAHSALSKDWTVEFGGGTPSDEQHLVSLSEHGPHLLLVPTNSWEEAEDDTTLLLRSKLAVYLHNCLTTATAQEVLD